MGKWLKRTVAVLAGLLVLILILAGVALLLVQSTPGWYQPGAMSDLQRQVAAQSATNKLITLQNQTAMARVDEQAARRGNRSATKPAGMSITLTDDELNALLSNWSVWQSVRSSYEKFLKDPYIVLMDGRVVLSGRVKELDAVASIHFEPKIDSKGQLRLTLAKVLAGKLPLPAATMTDYQKRAADAVGRRLPQWRQRATIDSTGLANDAAVSAVMGEMLMDVLNQQSSSPVVFMEVVAKGKMPMRLANVQVQDHSLTLIVQPMTLLERDELLQRIRGTPGNGSVSGE